MKYRIVETRSADGHSYFWPEWRKNWWTNAGVWKGIYREDVRGFEKSCSLPHSFEEAFRWIEAYDSQVVHGNDVKGSHPVMRIYHL